MNFLRTAGGIAATGLAMVLFSSATAMAEERICTGTIGAVTVDNVSVPQNKSCFLNRTIVKGTIKVAGGAILTANGVIVIGNVQAEGAHSVVVQYASRVGGSVQVVKSRAARVEASHVNGDIYFDENIAGVKAIRNRVGGNVQAFQNKNGVEIRGNTIEGNLQCKANTPAPTGGNNIVQGNKEDQCSKL